MLVNGAAGTAGTETLLKVGTQLAAGLGELGHYTRLLVHYKYGTGSRTLDSLRPVAMTKVIKNFNQASYRRSLCNYGYSSRDGSRPHWTRRPPPGSGVSPPEGAGGLADSCQEDRGLQM